MIRSVVLVVTCMAALAGFITGVSAQGAPAPGGLSVLSTNAIVGPLTAIVDAEKRAGRPVNVEFDTSPSINRRFAAGAITGVHVLVAAVPTVDQAITDGKAIASTRVRVGKVGVGVATRRGAARPDISTVEALTASLLKADAVVYSQGASGVYAVQLFAKLGIAEKLKGRTVQLTTGADMVERVQTSRGNEIGLTQISEITRAVEESKGALVYVGPLPASVQYFTVFDAVAMTGAPDRAAAFARSLTEPAARKLLAANAWEF